MVNETRKPVLHEWTYLDKKRKREEKETEKKHCKLKKLSNRQKLSLKVISPHICYSQARIQRENQHTETFILAKKT